MTSIIKVQNIQYTDGDAALTIADGGGVTAASTLTATGNLTTTGAFTSKGIDDNASSEMLNLEQNANSTTSKMLMVGENNNINNWSYNGRSGIVIEGTSNALLALGRTSTAGQSAYLYHDGALGIVNQEANNINIGYNTGTAIAIDSDRHITMPSQPSISVDGDQNSGAAIEAPSNVTYHTITEYSTTPANFYSQNISYNNINGRFTVPKSGKYLVGVNTYMYSNNKFMRVRVEVNDTRRTSFTNDFRTSAGDYGQDVSVSGTCLLNLSASDYITFRLYVGNNSGINYGRWEEHHGAFIHLLS